MPQIILVGGFLGSGKTTTLAAAARALSGDGNTQGKAVGLITNDQADQLVDTQLLQTEGNNVVEVFGSCFCCNFPGFTSAVESLVGKKAEIIVAEPVGSCTDLSATIVRPLQKFHPEWKLAPLSVLVDPNRLLEVFGKKETGVDADALYIMRIQMDEADRILVNKADTLTAKQRLEITGILKTAFPDKKTALISAKTAEGIDAWLNDILSATDVGKTIAEVDYDRYAHGEAVLGWLNATATGGNDPSMGLIGELLQSFQTEIQKTRSEVGHVKAIFGNTVGNLTSVDGDIEVRHRSVSYAAPVSELTFNARVQMPPEQLEIVVRELFQRFNLQVKVLKCLMPGRPNPTHRFGKV